VYLNSGVSSAASGLNQSDFSLWAFDSSKYMDVPFQPENEPLPLTVFSDDGNTATLGNLQGPLENLSGQLPSQSTRRDSHGIVAIADGNYVHTFDRIQAEVYVVDTATNAGSFAYSLRNSGVCKGIMDDTNLPEDDPSPDLLDTQLLMGCILLLPFVWSCSCDFCPYHTRIMPWRWYCKVGQWWKEW
jgi:hypothetical protein